MNISEETLASVGSADGKASSLAAACLLELSAQEGYRGSPEASRCAAAITGRLGKAQNEESTIVDLVRIGHFLARSQELPASGGFKALARAARRFCSHPAARNARERIADRGSLSWGAPAGWPDKAGRYACAHLGTTSALASESSAMGNCVADFEDGCASGHYAIASLVPLDPADLSLARCSLVLARSEDGSWEEYGLEARRHMSPPRSARDAADAIIARITPCR